MNHWKIRAIHGKPLGPIAGVYSELIAGRARIGWSYSDELDLRNIARDIWDDRALTDEQKDAKRCLPFFTGIQMHDVLWYPGIPAAHKVTVVRVTGDYDYDHGINGVYDSGEGYDFRSFRPCEAVAHSLDVEGGTKVHEWLNTPGRIGQASPEYAVVLSGGLDSVTETIAHWRFAGDPAGG